MPITYQQTTDKEIHDQVRRKHWAAINELKRLNFEEFYFFGETVQALGFSPLGVAGFFGTLIALFNEVTKIESNLSVSMFNVAMATREYATYGCPFGLGVKFYTSFTDGTCIISANFESPAINDDREKLYKFAVPRTVEATWRDHQKWVDKLSSEGKQKTYHLSFKDYLKLAKQEDSYLLKHEFTFRPNVSDSFLNFLSIIVSAGLFAGVAFMFWFLPRIVHNLYPACWFVRNVDKPSLLQNILIILICIAISWLLARITQKPFTVDGIGTKFFGNSPSSDSRGHISTKWLVVVFIPMLPVRSYQIVEEYPGGQHKTRYSIIPLDKLDWPQIRETIWKSKVGYVIFAIIMFGFGAWSFWECM